MKSRPFQRRDSDGKSATTSNASFKKKKVKKNLQRLGGTGGLSLEAFANAKSKTDYNPSLIKKQREFYKNAKFVNKYKKSLKQQSISEDHLPAASRPKVPLHIQDNVDGDGHKTKSIQKKTMNSSLQSLRQEYEKRREEEEKERIQREAQVQEKKERRAEAEARRRELKEKMFKRTRSGQPVMKYRIEHLLRDII